MWIEIFISPGPVQLICVTPRAGVWIEIGGDGSNNAESRVTPRAGVWIEILLEEGKEEMRLSLPVRECGLK